MQEYQKSGAKALKKLEDFRDDFVFKYEDTEKNMLIYNDEMENFELEDFQGHKEMLKNRYGCVLVPTTYELREIWRIFILNKWWFKQASNIWRGGINGKRL